MGVLQMKRSTHNQTCHDESVRRRAAGLEAAGWYVRADLPEYDEKPPKLCVDGECAIPDIYATYGKYTRIIEVETPDTIDKDWKQHNILRRWRNQHNNVEVNIRECDV